MILIRFFFFKIVIVLNIFPEFLLNPIIYRKVIKESKFKCELLRFSFWVRQQARSMQKLTTNNFSLYSPQPIKRSKDTQRNYTKENNVEINCPKTACRKSCGTFQNQKTTFLCFYNEENLSSNQPCSQKFPNQKIKILLIYPTSTVLWGRRLC